jgi:peptidoglycan/xylan/chitin deacetylase (PgdA/CDA1 family)
MSDGTRPPACITTSWDDGHPLDLRVAELLAKHGLRGTFYVPRSAENGTMTPSQVRELSSAFEVGAHTLRHVVLTATSDREAHQEITGSRAWVEDCTGRACPLFCPPRGKYAARHLRMVREAGYLAVRGVEMMSLDFPRRGDGLLMLPTTLQAHPHGLFAYARNLLRRAAFRNLWLYVAHGRSTDWSRLARSLLARAMERGGVFHLWGHSWELESAGQWQRLDEALRFLGQFTGRATALTNGQVCEAAIQL